MRRIDPLLPLLLAACPLAAQDERVNASGGELIPEQACFDVHMVGLSLEIDPEARRIDGSAVLAALWIEPSDRIALDLDSRLTVESVTGGDEGVALEFEHTEGRIWIDVPESLQSGEAIVVHIEYGGEPRVAPRPPWDGGFTWAETEDGRPWIATSCQGEGADLWWPCKDHPSDKPAMMMLEYIVPEGLVAASNGVLVGERELEDGRRSFQWMVNNPISNYCVALNVAPYVLLETTCESVAGGEFPVHFYVLPENEEKGRAFLDEIVEHLQFFERFCGPYPFRNEKYGVVETPHLGMEHQTIIAYGNQYSEGPWEYDWLHHHELAHEWWGNLVTCDDWKDMWIHEGIGTYMQPLYLEEKFGRTVYDQEMWNNLRRVANNRPIAPRETRNSKEIYFDRRGVSDSDIYFKGSWVMHTLRWHLGDETFFEVLRRWCYPGEEAEAATDGSQVRLLDSEVLIAEAEAIAGEELDWFFEVYLRNAELPEVVAEAGGGELVVSWNTPVEGPFPLDVEVEIGEELHRVELGEDGVGRVALPEGAEWRIDPRRLVLRKGLRESRPR